MNRIRSAWHSRGADGVPFFLAGKNTKEEPVFEDGTRKNKYGSTGLGMAITKNIVEMMNGTISVESEKGMGTEFTVVLPLRNSLYTGKAMGDAVDPDALRVLLVDDEEIVAERIFPSPSSRIICTRLLAN